MSKDECRRYSKRFVALGLLMLMVAGVNWVRTTPGNRWAPVSVVACVMVALTQFGLAYGFHKKGQGARD